LNIEKEDDLKLILALAKRLGVEHQVSLSEEEMEFYQGVSSAYEEVKLMVDGKREKKSLKTFLDEC
jgi:hypothetical protein